jgi:hypothetical protein
VAAVSMAAVAFTVAAVSTVVAGFTAAVVTEVADTAKLAW